jgi:hypothetical protein
MGDIPPGLNSQKVQRLGSPPLRPIQLCISPTFLLVRTRGFFLPGGKAYKTGNVHVRQYCAAFAQQFCRGEAGSMIYSECVSVALVTQHAKRMRRVMLSSVACVAVLDFSTLCYKRPDFRGKNLLSILCVFWLSIQFCWKNFSFWEELSEILS